MTQINSKLLWTHDDWIEKANQSEPDLAGCAIPVIHVSYDHDFAPSFNQKGSYFDFIKDVPYADKKALFQDSDIAVLFMAENQAKLTHLIHRPSHNGPHHDGPSIDQEFRAHQRNVFIVAVTALFSNFYFVCEYEND